MALNDLFGIELPIIQAPMAGVQGSALAVAVSNAGGLGSLPAAMLGTDALRRDLATLRAQTARPFNVNFFCHARPQPDAEREAVWRAALLPYFEELGVGPEAVVAGPVRAPFDAAAAEVLAELKPAVVSFHFGLPSPNTRRSQQLRFIRLHCFLCIGSRQQVHPDGAQIRSRTVAQPDQPCSPSCN